jgi:hypothetical protein
MPVGRIGKGSENDFALVEQRWRHWIPDKMIFQEERPLTLRIRNLTVYESEEIWIMPTKRS